VILLLANPVTAVKEAVIKHAAENYAEKILGQAYGTPGFWVALAMALVYLPFLGRLAAAHFFGKDGTVFGIGLTGICSVALTFGAICMADTSLSGFIPKSVEILVISLCTGTSCCSSRAPPPKSSAWASGRRWGCSSSSGTSSSWPSSRRAS